MIHDSYAVEYSGNPLIGKIVLPPPAGPLEDTEYSRDPVKGDKNIIPVFLCDLCGENKKKGGPKTAICHCRRTV